MSSRSRALCTRPLTRLTGYDVPRPDACHAADDEQFKEWQTQTRRLLGKRVSSALPHSILCCVHALEHAKPIKKVYTLWKKQVTDSQHAPRPPQSSQTSCDNLRPCLYGFPLQVVVVTSEQILNFDSQFHNLHTVFEGKLLDYDITRHSLLLELQSGQHLSVSFLLTFSFSPHFLSPICVHFSTVLHWNSQALIITKLCRSVCSYPLA